jgi:hypothetical protein
MSMPEIIREYLRTFELRRELSSMKSISAARRLPQWVPFRKALIRRRTRNVNRAEVFRSPEPTEMPLEPPPRAEVVYISNSDSGQAAQTKTGTD